MSWTVELPNLTNGERMFYKSGLTSWTVELPNLTNGSYMFGLCFGLTSFTAALPQLADGSDMFRMCKLDINSLRVIAESLPSIKTRKNITIGLNQDVFVEDDYQSLVNLITSKGWSVDIT